MTILVSTCGGSDSGGSEDDLKSDLVGGPHAVVESDEAALDHALVAQTELRRRGRSVRQRLQRGGPRWSLTASVPTVVFRNASCALHACAFAFAIIIAEVVIVVLLLLLDVGANVVRHAILRVRLRLLLHGDAAFTLDLGVVCSAIDTLPVALCSTGSLRQVSTRGAV